MFKVSSFSSSKAWSRWKGKVGSWGALSLVIESTAGRQTL